MAIGKYSGRSLSLVLSLLFVLNIFWGNTLFGEEDNALRRTEEVASGYIRAKEYEKAIQTYQEFIDKYPQSSKVKQILKEIASTYRYKGDFSKAVETYQTIIEKFPGSSEATSSLLLMGHIYQLELREYDKAIEAYNKVIETSSNDNTIQTAKGDIIDCYNALGKVDKAIELSRDYLSKPLPQREWAMGMRNLATLYVKKENYDEGIRILKEIIEKYPKTEEAATAHSLLVDIYRDKIMNYQKMLQECDNIINTYPKEQWIVFFALATKATTYSSNLKDYDKAIEVYQTIIKTYPNSDMEKHAKAGLRIIKEYYKSGKIPSIEEIERIREEEGLKEGGIISIP